MKQAVLAYQRTARRITDQQRRNRETLSEALAAADNTALFVEMQEAETKAHNQIQSVLDVVSGGLGKAVPLNGKDVTEDVQLLSGAFDLSREQLQGLVEKDIAIEDTGVYHAVAFAAEGKVCANVVGDIHFPLAVFFREDGRTAGDGAYQRHLSHGGHGDNGDDVGGQTDFRGPIPTHDN